MLPVDHVWSLVWWEEGVVKTIPISRMKANGIRITAFDFPMSQLLARWGVTSAIVDAYLEEHMYRFDPDVLKVRATRRPLTGKTVKVVRHQHGTPRVRRR